MEKWVEEGQRKWMNERRKVVVFVGMRVVFAFQPVREADEEGMNAYKGAFENETAMSARERLIALANKKLLFIHFFLQLDFNFC